MKENYYDKAISFAALYQGLKASCRSVRWKGSVIRYEAYGLKNTYLLRQSLLNGTYQISPYQKFVIYEPKKRIIYAPRIKDRQVQHALCDNGLYQDIAEHFIRDNMACQKGRGTDDALNRFKVLLRRYVNKNGVDGWVLKCDVHHFFPTTPHKTVKDAAEKYISDEKSRAMVYDVIDSFDGDRGLGLGSQICQIIELLVLNDLDHFIKEQLRIKCYIRYMDDFILIHPDKQYLQQCRSTIAARLAAIGLTLNKKTTLQPLNHGVMFLKWHYMIESTGHIYMLMNRKKIAKQKHRMNKLPADKANQSLTSFLANTFRGNTWKIQQYIKTLYRS